MEPKQSLQDLIGTAQVNAKVTEDRVLQIRAQIDGQEPTKTQQEDLDLAIADLELATVDIYSAFEARMQHHFKRGPFSRKLKALLLNAQQDDLAGRIYDYYLAVNVLKHGKGASHRELLDAPSALFDVVRAPDVINDETQPRLIDISAKGFFDGLTATLLEAADFLENKQGV